jgi:hypothetical protein
VSDIFPSLKVSVESISYVEFSCSDLCLFSNCNNEFLTWKNWKELMV